jgi:hypothetical protein
VADYLSFNLSARACAPLLAPARLPLVEAALRAAAAARAGLPRRVPLALKFRLGGADEAPPAVALAAAAAGFDLLTAVLPDNPGRLSSLRALITALPGGPAVVAVGGIRNAHDVAEVRAIGAAGVQVHRVFAEAGSACLRDLLPTAPDQLPSVGEVEHQGRGRIAAHAAKTAGAGHVQHRGADAVAQHVPCAQHGCELDDVGEQGPAQAAAAPGGGHAETEIDLAVTGGDVRERHDPSARVGQAVDVVAREVDAGDVAGDPFVTDAVAEAKKAIVDIEHHEVGEKALGIRRCKPDQRAGRAVPLAIVRSEESGGDWTGDDGHGGDPGQAGGISGGQDRTSPAPRREQGPAGSSARRASEMVWTMPLVRDTPP